MAGIGGERTDGRRARWDRWARPDRLRGRHILDTAIDALEEVGPGVEVKAQEVAAAAGLSRPVAYRHFDGRADVDGAARERIVERERLLAAAFDGPVSASAATPAAVSAEDRGGAVSATEELYQDGLGEPDGLERLWTPHRMAYIRGENKPDDDTSGTCPFCRVPGLPDTEGLVVHRGDLVFAVLNLYPYAPGHLLVCPYRHIADYTETTDEEAAEMADLTRAAMRTLRRVSQAAGFNLGMNQGDIAGAGIAAHLHQHVVPRWPGDQNFMPVIGRTKTLPELLGDTRGLLADAWG